MHIYIYMESYQYCNLNLYLNMDPVSLGRPGLVDPWICGSRNAFFGQAVLLCGDKGSGVGFKI